MKFHIVLFCGLWALLVQRLGAERALLRKGFSPDAEATENLLSDDQYYSDQQQGDADTDGSYGSETGYYSSSGEDAAGHEQADAGHEQADADGLETAQLGKACTMFGKKGICMHPTECATKNGGRGYTPIIGGCGVSAPVFEDFHLVKKFGSAISQCCVREDDKCVHDPMDIPKPKAVGRKKIYKTPSTKSDSEVKAGKAYFSCDTAFGGGTCVLKKECIGDEFISINSLVSGPYLFIGGEFGFTQRVAAWSGRQSGFACENSRETVSRAFWNGAKNIYNNAANKLNLNWWGGGKSEEEAKPVEAEPLDERELGLIDWAKKKVAQVKKFVKKVATSVLMVIGKAVGGIFGWASSSVREAQKYTCCVKPTCSTDCRTPSTSLLGSGQAKCQQARKFKPDGKEDVIKAPFGTQWMEGYCPSSITAVQREEATKDTQPDAKWVEENSASRAWYKATNIALGDSGMQCAVPTGGPLTETISFFDGVPRDNVNAYIDIGAGTARPLIQGDLDSGKLGILTHATIPIMQAAQIASATDKGVKAAASLNGMTGQYSGLLGRTGFKDKYTFTGLNSGAALALTDSVSPLTASSMAKAARKGTKGKKSETVVVTVTHEFLDDESGTLAAAIEADLDPTKPDRYAAQAEIQLMFSKYAYVMACQAIKKSTGASSCPFEDDTLSHPEIHNAHVGKSILNSISFNTIDYYASDAPKDVHGRMLGAPKGKGVKVGYKVQVSVDATKMATKNKLSTPNQVAVCLNGQYTDATQANGALVQQATAVKQHGVANTNGKPVKSNSALVAAMASMGGRRLSGTEELDEELVRELAANSRFPMQSSGISATFQVITA